MSYHFVKESAFFEAEQVVVTSASSKTSLALAFLLHQNKAEDGKKIIGLTSAKNVDFVTQSGYYDEVISYDKVGQDLQGVATTVVDMAGNSGFLKRAIRTIGRAFKIRMSYWLNGLDGS